MSLRKVLARWLQLAPIVLPVWLFVGFGIWGGSAWGLFGVAVLAIVVAVVLGVIALLVWSRPSVRRTKAVSWRDAGVFGVLQFAVFAIGFYGPSGVTWTVLAVLAAIAAFWYALITLVQDGAREAKAQFDQAAAAAGQMPGRTAPVSEGPVDIGEVIVVQERRTER